MTSTRHGEEQINAILKQGEAGLATSELCRLDNLNGNSTHFCQSVVKGTASQHFEAEQLVIPITRFLPRLRKVRAEPAVP
jgi:hypothetical protein